MPEDATSKKPAREQRIEREAAEQEKAKQRQRLLVLAGVAAAVAVVFVALLAAGVFKSDPAGKSKPTPSGVKGVSETNKMLDGIPVNGMVLGKKNAKVTLHEFIDLKCPVCQYYQLNDQPKVIEKYVRTGKVKIEVHVYPVIDKMVGSTDAAVAHTALYNLSDSKFAWKFLNAVFWNQENENDSWATPEKLKKIATAVGVPASEFSTSGTAISSGHLSEDVKLARQLGVTSTPSIVLQPTGAREYTVVGDGAPSMDQIDAAMAKILK